MSAARRCWVLNEAQARSRNWTPAAADSYETAASSPSRLCIPWTSTGTTNNSDAILGQSVSKHHWRVAVPENMKTANRLLTHYLILPEFVHDFGESRISSPVSPQVYWNRQEEEELNLFQLSNTIWCILSFLWKPSDLWSLTQNIVSIYICKFYWCSLSDSLYRGC